MCWGVGVGEGRFGERCEELLGGSVRGVGREVWENVGGSVLGSGGGVGRSAGKRLYR